MRNAWVWTLAACLLLAGCADESSTAQRPQGAEMREQWTVSPVFETSDGSKVRGVKNRAGILVHGENGLEVTQEFQKYMWLIWGDKQKLAQGTLEIYGTHRDDGKRQLLHKDSNLVYAGHGADAQTLSGPTFPKKGLWKIDVMLNGQPHASFVLDVK